MIASNRQCKTDNLGFPAIAIISTLGLLTHKCSYCESFLTTFQRSGIIIG